MAEESLRLLTSVEEVPGKIIYSTLFSLSKLFCVPQVSVSSLKRCREPGTELDTKLDSGKRLKLGLPETNQSMESAFHVTMEDVLEDIDIKLRHEEVEREEVHRKCELEK